MVLMAQPFSYRYPLIDGQGNFGSPDDPKSFAAMRYTESKLTPFADLLLAELGQGTVDWIPNFDGTLEEPIVVAGAPAAPPAQRHHRHRGRHGHRCPAAQSARGVSGLRAPARRSRTPPCGSVRARARPGFPTRPKSSRPRADLRALYETGNGSVRARACMDARTGRHRDHRAAAPGLAEQVLEQIAAADAGEEAAVVEDLRDESDHENPRGW
jgi:topoisomerase-4 subunit A